MPLLNMGALVKYRMGEGGIVLNDVKVQESESNPINAQKKQNIVATLLRNLGAAFAGERLVMAGCNVKYTPMPLGDKCTQFLTKEKGWFEGGTTSASSRSARNPCRCALLGPRLPARRRCRLALCYPATA